MMILWGREILLSIAPKAIRSNEPPCNASWIVADVIGSSDSDDAPAILATARSHIDDVVGRANDIQIVLYDDYGRTMVY